MVEAVGHADGDLDAVVGRLEPGVGVAELDGPEDVRAPSPDPPREFDYLGDTVVGRPEHPMVQFRLGLVAHQPRALGLEVAREPAARFRPRHPGDHDAAFRTIHARHRGDQSDPPAAEILMTPATHAAALAVTVASPATHLRAPGLFISETRILVRINKKHPGRSSASAGAFVTVCPIE